MNKKNLNKMKTIMPSKGSNLCVRRQYFRKQQQRNKQIVCSVTNGAIYLRSARIQSQVHSTAILTMLPAAICYMYAHTYSTYSSKWM